MKSQKKPLADNKVVFGLLSKEDQELLKSTDMSNILYYNSNGIWTKMGEVGFRMSFEKWSTFRIRYDNVIKVRITKKGKDIPRIELTATAARLIREIEEELKCTNQC